MRGDYTRLRLVFHSGFLLPTLLILASGCGRQPEAAPVDADPVATGWTHYRLGEFDSAVRAFELARIQHPPASPQHLLALYGLATTWNLRTPLGDQDKPLARGYYEEILTQAPNDDFAAWSLLALARLQHVVPVGEEPDYDAVRAAYDNVIVRFPEHLAGQEAFIYRQATYVQTLEVAPTRQAITALQAFIADHPTTGFRSGAHSLLAAAFETLHEPEQQLAAELKALDTMEYDPTNPKFENSGTYWKIATIAEFEVGDFETARRFYRRLITEYPQDIRVFASEEALLRMDAVEARLKQEPGGHT